MRWVNRDRSAAMDCTSLEGYLQGEAEGAEIWEPVGLRWGLTGNLYTAIIIHIRMLWSNNNETDPTVP